MNFQKRNEVSKDRGIYKIFNFQKDNSIAYQMHVPKGLGMCGNGMLGFEKTNWEVQDNDLIIHVKGSYFGDSRFEYKLKYEVAQLTDTELKLVLKEKLLAETTPFM